MAEEEVHCRTKVALLGFWLPELGIFGPPSLPAVSYEFLDLIF
jgi:hypothetical protein